MDWIADYPYWKRQVTYQMRFGGQPESCTPGYYNQEGRPMDERRDIRLEGYAHGSAAYWKKFEEWRNAGQLEGLELDQ